MKVELTEGDLQIITMAIDNMTIKGKDAPVIATLINKLGKSIEKAMT